MARFTRVESAPTLAGFGRLRIVNDDVADELHDAPLFGIGSLQMVPLAEQEFFRNEVWKAGVQQLIKEAALFVFDVSTFSPGLAWELETVASLPGARILFIARRGAAAPRFMSAGAARAGDGRDGTLSRPLPYSSSFLPWPFRVRVIRWMRENGRSDLGRGVEAR